MAVFAATALSNCFLGTRFAVKADLAGLVTVDVIDNKAVEK